MTTEYQLPVTLLPQIKTSLIKAGYATETTPLENIQDIYYNYVTINRTSWLEAPSIPYAVENLPKALRILLSGVDSGEGVEYFNTFHTGGDLTKFTATTLDVNLFTYPEMSALKNPSFATTHPDAVSGTFALHTWYFTFDRTKLSIGDTIYIDLYENAGADNEIRRSLDPITIAQPVAPLSPMSQLPTITHRDAARTETGVVLGVQPEKVYFALNTNEVGNDAIIVKHNSILKPKIDEGKFQIACDVNFGMLALLSLSVTGKDNLNLPNEPESYFISASNQPSGSVGMYFVGTEEYGTPKDISIAANGIEVDINSFATVPRSATVAIDGLCNAETGLWDIKLKAFNAYVSTEIYVEHSVAQIDLGTPAGTAELNIALSIVGLPNMGTTTGGVLDRIVFSESRYDNWA